MMMTSRQIVDRQKRRGATILEVLVVLAIIAMIAAVVGPRLVGYLGKAKSETAALQIEQIGNALQLFYIDTGRYPSREEGLAVLFTAPAASPDWSGPYLEAEEALSDPWGRAYLYEPPTDNGNFKVESLGRDGVRGGSGEDADLS
ncbi:Type II secretion system protein G precursor [Pelagimonas phthalicica]|uniref:Type II secretion system core protein G n=1 Tax=Pelagimonas phthalicica TaxID=1037362 RepID=A0A238JJW2_9RHOB|nr:type II secretion system major pseudopilin GspG [Pelagimonas phthalicica]TDS88371.1 type II secretion system protein G (GspG) [Pelagimonas phthalicica]SMX30457.1 Type II secretion system protein G precursor [Pelagimonas phthalicica]